jgi:O-methyltransferase
MITRRLVVSMFAVYKALGIKKLLKYAPAAVQKWRDTAKVRLRPKLTFEETLTPMYREGLRRLMGRYGADSLGDYVEFGVYNGTSLIAMDRVLNELGLNHVRLFGFDSFEGLPGTAEFDDAGYWQPGAYQSDMEFTLRVLKTYNVRMERVVLIKGFFESTLTPELKQTHRLQKASVIMVDCDMYLSAKEVLRFCQQLIVDEAMVVFDDWHTLADKGLGEKRAFDEFLNEHSCLEANEFGDYPPYGKVFFVKQKRAQNRVEDFYPAVVNH